MVANQKFVQVERGGKSFILWGGAGMLEGRLLF